MLRLKYLLLLGVLAVALTACGGDTGNAVDVVDAATSDTTVPISTNPAPEQRCADVIGVVIEPGEGGFTISATVASADTGWDKYADLWEVRAPDGTVLGERVLAHPHETEQPFTRSVGGVAIPPDVTEVVVAARDSVDGFCGAEFVAEVPHP